jgi:lipopolysaccharide transport system ATP-binding protein
VSEPIIRVENLGKKYLIRHQEGRPRYRALRDVLADVLKSAVGMLRGRRTGERTDREEFWALQDVNLDVQEGEVVGIIGRNGAGKSTLLKILSRITEPTAGRVTLHGRVASLLEVGTGFHPELTGRENIYLNGSILGMRRREIDRKFDEIVAFAEVETFLDTPVKRYSSGMYVRLAFAVAAHLEPEILVVDEVLAVGDAEFQKKCLGKMRAVAYQGRTVLFVSHNLAAVCNLCSRAVLLRAGKVTQDGSVQEVVARYLGSQDRSTEVRYDHGPVRRLSIRQQGSVIEATAEFTMPHPIRLPCFGVAVSDSNGTVLFGTNPKQTGTAPLSVPTTTGTVRAVFSQPKLRDGRYRASCWFGDGVRDVFVEHDCLTFDVVGMGTPEGDAVGTVGPVHPRCEFFFSGGLEENGRVPCGQGADSRCD